MRTAITLAQTHAGKWVLLANPDEPLVVQRKKAHAIRAEKANADYARVIYQENDGHALHIPLLTPEALKAREKQNAHDHAEAKKFDDEQAKLKEKNPARAKAAADFKRNEEQAAEIEAYAAKKEIPVHQAAEELGLETKPAKAAKHKTK